MSAWDVWVPDRGQLREDCRCVKAARPDQAAEAFAERDDYESADFTFASGSDSEVHVAELGSTKVHVFTIAAESRPTYYATRKR
jgi:hypothetical protein